MDLSWCDAVAKTVPKNIWQIVLEGRPNPKPVYKVLESDCELDLIA